MINPVVLFKSIKSLSWHFTTWSTRIKPLSSKMWHNLPHNIIHIILPHDFPRQQRCDIAEDGCGRADEQPNLERDAELHGRGRGGPDRPADRGDALGLLSRPRQRLPRRLLDRARERLRGRPGRLVSSGGARSELCNSVVVWRKSLAIFSWILRLEFV